MNKYVPAITLLLELLEESKKDEEIVRNNIGSNTISIGGPPCTGKTAAIVALAGVDDLIVSAHEGADVSLLSALKDKQDTAVPTVVTYKKLENNFYLPHRLQFRASYFKRIWLDDFRHYTLTQRMDFGKWVNQSKDEGIPTIIEVS